MQSTFEPGPDERPTLITGGCGFVGTNLADRLLTDGGRVIVFDDLSRPGVRRNLAWLKATHGGRVTEVVADVRDPDAVLHAVRQAKAVFHFAAQVAVTTSLQDAVGDFEINARGTLNVLEAVRRQNVPPPLIFTSTNKVYGGLSDIEMRRRDRRYEPASDSVRDCGIGEQRPLDFHSPYGCSKGAADQYVLDYARTFGLPACVFRMSCIYGPHQCGNEDQGWVAHFLINALRGEPLTIFGDGCQVRDVLYVDDLVDAFLLAVGDIDSVRGLAFNVGGGPDNAVSLHELLALIAGLNDRRPVTRFDDWRAGDQRYYVSDTRRLRYTLGWTPKTSVENGVRRLNEWLSENVCRLPAADKSRGRWPDVDLPVSELMPSAEGRR